MFMPPPPPRENAGDVIKNEELLTEEMLELKFINGKNAVFKATKGGFASLEFEDKLYKMCIRDRVWPVKCPSRAYSSLRLCRRL